ncbi:MAG: cation diffusion facilitator family transporter [Streptosporangiales bacterium]|nr:cation diffusion facilitator family transporter [Streptosporangiales bacterium]
MSAEREYSDEQSSGEFSASTGHTHVHATEPHRARNAQVDPGSHAGHGHDHGDVHGHGHGHGHEHGHEHRTGFVGALVSVFRPHSHDAADSIDGALVASRAGIRAVKISLVGLGITAGLQLVVVAITGSIALLADTIHNFSDALTAVPLWLAFSLGMRPVTRKFTHGYHRAEDLAGLFIVLMIALSAVVAGYQAIDRLINPRAIEYVGLVALAGVIGFIGNEAVAIYRIRVGRQIGSAALVADGYHARTDGLTSLAVLIGAGGVALGFPLADPIIGLVISAAILVVLKQAAGSVFRRAMDGIEPEIVDDLESAALATDGVLSVERCRARWIGHGLAAEMSLSVNGALHVGDADHIVHDVEHRLRARVPKLRTVTISVTAAGSQQDQVMAEPRAD